MYVFLIIPDFRRLNWPKNRITDIARLLSEKYYFSVPILATFPLLILSNTISSPTVPYLSLDISAHRSPAITFISGPPSNASPTVRVQYSTVMCHNQARIEEDCVPVLYGRSSRPLPSLSHMPHMPTYAHGAFEKRALPVALEAYKLASDPRALGKKTVNA